MTAGAAAAPALTADQLEKERSIRFGLVTDCFLLSSYLVIALATGSFTLLAECIRAVPMNALEAASLVALRRIHRGQLGNLQFGIGKLEQLFNVAIAFGMLAGAAWIVVGGLQILAGEQHAATPIGLTIAAVTNSVNVLLNFMIWESVRRAAALERSLIMEGQLASRRAKLFSSAVVQCTMTVAALSLDPLIAAWADVAGSLFVAGVIIAAALPLMRDGVPDLLDLWTPEETRAAVDRVLAERAGDYVRLERVRSRRSGDTVFIEVTLALAGSMSMGEAEECTRALRLALAAAVPGAEVVVLVAAAGQSAPG